jgi:2-(3-amino-3-carboxypropyl)histidine synthase
LDPTLVDQVLAASHLPLSSYGLELEKCINMIVVKSCTHVALQLPEGLVRYATALADVFLALCPAAATAYHQQQHQQQQQQLLDADTAGNALETKQKVTNILQHVVILADVTYGACCVDDVTAAALDCPLLIHYGHSCLVPLTHTVVPVLYVFVEVQFDAAHAAACLVATTLQQEQQQQQTTTTTATTTTDAAAAASQTTTTTGTTHIPLETTPHRVDTTRVKQDSCPVDHNDGTTDTEPSTTTTVESTESTTTAVSSEMALSLSCSPRSPPRPPPPPSLPHVYLLGTIQFRHALTTIRAQLMLQEPYASSLGAAVSIPQCHPLSPGEVLGCTSPTLVDHHQTNDSTAATATAAIVCFVADGRFHLESTMLAHSNDASIQAFYRYDPYARVLTREWYGTYKCIDTSSVFLEITRVARATAVGTRLVVALWWRLAHFCSVYTLILSRSHIV